MFKFILTDNEIRYKMISFLRPICSSNDIGYRNINWADGVYDDENKIFITQIYSVSNGIARCDMDFNHYIVIIDGKTVFSVTNNKNYITGGYDFKISSDHQEFSEIVKEGIQVYINRKEHSEFEKYIEEKNGEGFKYSEYYHNIKSQMDKRIF